MRKGGIEGRDKGSEEDRKEEREEIEMDVKEDKEGRREDEIDLISYSCFLQSIPIPLELFFLFMAPHCITTHHTSSQIMAMQSHERIRAHTHTQ